MIEAWFNERGYSFTTAKGEGRFIYDLPSSVVDNASELYTCRWIVLNQMMEAIDEIRDTTEDTVLVLHTDSRLIEELQGDVVPDTEYAKSSLRYFIEVDYVNFRRVSFQKCASTTVNGRLSEAVDPTRSSTA